VPRTLAAEKERLRAAVCAARDAYEAAMQEDSADVAARKHRALLLLAHRWRTRYSHETFDLSGWRDAND
jgi:hypothetical protein